MKDIFSFFLDNINTYYRSVMVATLFLPRTMPKTFLVVLVFFTGLTLVGRRLLEVLPTKYVRKRSINELILLRVLLFLFYRPTPLETLSINLANT